MLPAPQVTLPMSGKIANILGPEYGWSWWNNEDLLADRVEFFCSGSVVQRSMWAKSWAVSEAEKKRRRTEAANAVTPLSVVDLVLLLKIPRRRYYCARFACDIARTSAHSTRFVDFCVLRSHVARAIFLRYEDLITWTRSKVPTHLFSSPSHASFATEWNQLASRQHLQVAVYTDGVTVFL